MSTLFQWLLDNKEWFFSGIGVTLLSTFIFFFKNAENKSDSKSKQYQQKQSVSQIVNVNFPKSDSIPSSSNEKKCDKEGVSILFIDDQSFDYIKNLKQAGFINVKKISNVKRIDAPEIYNADIIFVDINGVGANLFPNEQGLGVAKAIKKQFGDKKKVYLYSAQHQALNSDFNQLDGVLSKNADPYEFINIIDNYRNS